MAAVVERVATGGHARVVLCGSPRANGRSAEFARTLGRQLAERYPKDGLVLVWLSEAKVAGCIGCERCREMGACFRDDDMVIIDAALSQAREIHLVSPVYFAGPPSQLKAALDRLQPHYWKKTRSLQKRAAYLYVLGEGGDPYGFEPLVTICRSTLDVAGFKVLGVQAHIGSEEQPGPEIQSGEGTLDG